jgi:4-hydroxybenzoate polyprenyltransferase
MMNYIRIARPDHWVKNLLIYPGTLFALLLVGYSGSISQLLLRLVIIFLSTCLISSANYVINEWLDAKFDLFHPTKKMRPVVQNIMSVKWIIIEYIVLTLGGLVLALIISTYFFYCELCLLLMGILYNVKPFRTKDIPYLDVISESVNNVIRLLLGWFAVTSIYLPPATIVFGYWFGGAFLMAIKRYAEYRMIKDKEKAGCYRKSFIFYTEQSLLVSSFFYALCSLFLCGIFIVKYKIELLLTIPFLCGLFCIYLNLAFKEDSAVQKPEKLYSDKGLLFYILLLVIIFIIFSVVDIPALHFFLNSTIIRM